MHRYKVVNPPYFMYYFVGTKIELAAVSASQCLTAKLC